MGQTNTRSIAEWKKKKKSYIWICYIYIFDDKINEYISIQKNMIWHGWQFQIYLSIIINFRSKCNIHASFYGSGLMEEGVSVWVEMKCGLHFPPWSCLWGCWTFQLHSTMFLQKSIWMVFRICMLNMILIYLNFVLKWSLHLFENPYQAYCRWAYKIPSGWRFCSFNHTTYWHFGNFICQLYHTR